MITTKKRHHVVRSETWLTDEVLAAKRRIEAFQDPNHSHIREANKEARKRKLDELEGKAVRSYGNV
ncbi:hypothetical protein ACOMICROBIO_GDFFDHBD_02483 [Vibrio sp. B1REV9]|nr:hypothetical protein ACOMICROBIO_GDFFDHBD_02483 [Vibrio sp. B1REV9]